MTSPDQATEAPAKSPPRPTFARPIVLVVLGLCVLLAIGALLVTGASDGWHVAAEQISRFSVLSFVAWLSVEPLAKIFPGKFMRATAAEHDSLLFAFVAAFAMALLCVLVSAVFGVAQLTLAALVYCALNAAVLVVLLLSLSPAAAGMMSGRSWLAMQRVATAYYWLAFTMWDMGRLGTADSGNGWYEFSLSLLLGVLLVRFAGWFVTRQRTRQLAGNVG